MRRWAPTDESGRWAHNEKHLISAQHLSLCSARRPTARSSKLINNYVLSQVQRFRALSTRTNIFGTAPRTETREMQPKRSGGCAKRERKRQCWEQQPFPFSPLDRAPLCALSRFRAVLRKASSSRPANCMFVIIIISSLVCAGIPTII